MVRGIRRPKLNRPNTNTQPVFLARFFLLQGGMQKWYPTGPSCHTGRPTLLEIWGFGPWIDSAGKSTNHRLQLYCYTSSTAQGGGRSFKNRKPIGEVGCCDSRMAERIHWWTERWLELCFLEWLQWLQWSPHHNCWMLCGVVQLHL